MLPSPGCRALWGGRGVPGAALLSQAQGWQHPAVAGGGGDGWGPRAFQTQPPRSHVNADPFAEICCGICTPESSGEAAGASEAGGR